MISAGKESEAPFIVFSLALQPLLSIAHKYGMSFKAVLSVTSTGVSDLSVQSTADRLARFLRSLGADLVLDLKLAEDWSILELQRELLARHRAQEAARSRTLLSSLCPGWVCYAEKTHGDWLLPHISK